MTKEEINPNKMNNILIWLNAHFTDLKCWRVAYDNELMFTRPLCKKEAKGLANIFEGKAWIDYKTQRR